MAKIIELIRKDRSSQSLPQRNDMLSTLVHAKIVKSFRIIEHEVIPLLDEIDSSIKLAIRDASSDQLSDVMVESVIAAENLVKEIQVLVTSYRNILVPD